MEPLIFVLGLAALGAAAMRWGVDTRPDVGDTHGYRRTR